MKTDLDQGSVSSKALPGARSVPRSHEHTLSGARPPSGYSHSQTYVGNVGDCLELMKRMLQTAQGWRRKHP